MSKNIKEQFIGSEKTVQPQPDGLVVAPGCSFATCKGVLTEGEKITAIHLCTNRLDDIDEQKKIASASLVDLKETGKVVTEAEYKKLLKLSTNKAAK